MFSIEHLSYQAANKNLLHDINATIAPAQITLLMGANGAGKSLLLRLCAGLLTPSAGQVSLAKTDAHLVHQHPILLRRSTEANLHYVRHIKPSVSFARVQQALQQFDLMNQRHTVATSLSGGEQQRLSLARAWLLSPKVYLLDEPTAALDPTAAAQIELSIRSLREQGATVLLSCHQLGLARRLADHVMFLSNGRMLEHTDAQTFFLRPATTAAQTFLTSAFGERT